MIVAQASDLPRRGRALGDGGALRRQVSSSVPALLYGVRVSASVCLALIAAFWLQLDDAYWAATSAAIVAQPALGASLRKGRFRAIGTVIGAIFIVVLVSAFPQDRFAFLASLTLWAGVFGYLATILPNFMGYAAALAGYTTAIVFAGIADHPDNVFLVTVWRTLEIGLGTLCAGLVHALTDLGDARRRVGLALTQIGRSIAQGLGATLCVGEETLKLRTSRRALIARAIALDATIDEAIGEDSYLRRQRGRLQAAVQALFVALSGWRGIGNHLAASSDSSRSEWVPALRRSLERLADKDWLADPPGTVTLCQTEARHLCASASSEKVSSRVLVSGVVQLLRALEAVADTLVATARARDLVRTRGRSWPYVADHLPAVVNGLRIVLALIASELIWIATSWPHGPIMITFTAVNVILAGRQADAGAYSWAVEFALGCAIAGLLAVVLDLAILPLVHSGAFGLSLALTLVLLPLGALSAGSWHKVLFVAAATNVMPILALENEPVYDAVRIFDSALAVGAGVVIAAICVRLLPPVPPRRRIERLLRVTLRNLRQLVGGDRKFTRDAWLGLVCARFAAMPEEASLEEEAQLLTMLSVGEAAIALHTAQSPYPERDLLDHAFACLAGARIAEARASFARFSASQSAPVLGTREVDVAVQATLIADALERHQCFFEKVG